MRVVNGVRLAFQAGTEDFDHPSPLQFLSLCNVNLVDGLIWSQEAVGSNPTMETNLCLGSLMEEPRCYIPMMGVRFSNEVPSIMLL